jgi:hypothetical protein
MKTALRESAFVRALQMTLVVLVASFCAGCYQPRISTNLHDERGVMSPKVVLVKSAPDLKKDYQQYLETAKRGFEKSLMAEGYRITEEGGPAHQLEVRMKIDRAGFGFAGEFPAHFDVSISAVAFDRSGRRLWDGTCEFQDAALFNIDKDGYRQLRSLIARVSGSLGEYFGKNHQVEVEKSEIYDAESPAAKKRSEKD